MCRVGQGAEESATEDKEPSAVFDVIARTIAAVLAAVAGFLLRRPVGERPKVGAPARSPRVSAPPPSPSEYVGRQPEEDAVAELVLADRSVCITGSPGIGKSCLAMAVVRRQDVKDCFWDGILWVAAAGMGFRAMCEAVGSALETGQVARANTEQEKLGALRTAIAGRKVLVVLDNCEDPVAAERFAQEVHSPTLVTSRQRPARLEPVTLERLTDEQCLEILRRTSPRTLEPEEEAAALEIARLLQGHPLAVALAGPQLERASAEQLLEDLGRAPRPVVGDIGREQRALDASLDDAYKRLSGEERRLFASLGVFGGPSFDLAAVQAVEPSVDAVRMEALVRRSLVRKEDGRYALDPLVRRYCSDRLGRRQQPYLRIVQHYLALAQALGQDPSTFARLEPDLGNALAAMDWCLQARQWENAANFALALDQYLSYRGLWDERRRRLEQGRRAARRAGDSWLVAACSHNLAVVAQNQADYEEARRLYQEILGMAHQLGDRPGIAVVTHQLGTLAQDEGDYEEARRLHMESLAIDQELGNRMGIAISKHQLAMLAQDEGHYEEARRLYEESLVIFRELGDRQSMAMTEYELGALAQYQGEYEESRRLYAESLAIFEELGDRLGIAKGKQQLGMLAREQGEYEEAGRLYQDSLALFEHLGDRASIALTKHQLGMLAQEQGDCEEARRLYQESLAVEEEIGDLWGNAATKHQLGTLAEEEGDTAAARDLYQEALAIFEELGSPDAEIARESLERLSSAEGKNEQ